MSSLLFFLYSIGIRLGNVLIYIGKLFSPKLSLLYYGRKKTWKILEGYEGTIHQPCWIHCASLGEFEQGRPLIEKIRLNHPEVPLVLSFYSPSGYEVMKNYDRVDLVIYLPSDVPSNARKLILLIKPRMIIFVKYEFWWNLIKEIQKQNIKIFLISGVFRKDNYFFKTIFISFRNLLRQFDQIFVQDEASMLLLNNHGISNSMCVGDTRIDRVIQRSQSYDVPENLIQYCAEKKVIIYGSVWKSDIGLINEIINHMPDFVHMIAPHDINSDNIKDIRKAINQTCDLYSDDAWRHKLMILDNIGMLSGLYKLAKYAYVGGGFQNGIHNILEPAVFGIPVFFGPNFTKFIEAVQLKNNGMSFAINEAPEMLQQIQVFENDRAQYHELNSKLQSFFTINKGASEKIARSLSENFN